MKSSPYNPDIRHHARHVGLFLSRIASYLVGILAVTLAACGGGGGGQTPSHLGSFSIGGSLAGVSGNETVVLQNNGAGDLTLDASFTAKPFVFATQVPGAYAVTVKSAPAGKTCTVAHGSGTATADVSSVQVTCALIAQTYNVGGSVSGLATGESVTLQNNSGDDLTQVANGNFTFNSKVAQGASWAVTVKTQPGGTKVCTVGNGSGTATANVSTVQVTCSTVTYKVGGTVSGLSGTVVLTNNGADDLSLAASGNFQFAGAIAAGGAYNVQVKSSPAQQTCTAGKNTGTANADVATVEVICADKALATWTVFIQVQGLAVGKTLVVQNNGGDDMTVNDPDPTSSYTFPTRLVNGSPINVTIKTQPAGLTCSPLQTPGTTVQSRHTVVVIQCTNNSFTVGGSVSGLGSGKSLVLGINGVTQTLSANGGFTLNEALANGTPFILSVQTQPVGQTCKISGINGAVNGANVTDRLVTCADALAGYPSGNTVKTYANDSRMAGIAVAADTGEVFVSEFYGNFGVRHFASLMDLESGASDRYGQQANGNDFAHLGNEAIAVNALYVAVASTETDVGGQKGQVYVHDRKASATGKVRASIINGGTETGVFKQFNYPRGLAFGADGGLYIVDDHNNRIVRCTNPADPGTCSTFIANVSPGPMHDGYIKGLAQHPTSQDWYVTDYATCKVRVFSKAGAVVSRSINFNTSYCPIDLAFSTWPQGPNLLYVTTIDHANEGRTGLLYAMTPADSATSVFDSKKDYGNDAAKGITMGDSLWGVAVDPATGAVLLVNSNWDPAKAQQVLIYKQP